MKISKLTAAVALSAAATAFSTGAAAYTITNADGPNSFGGFDWASGAAAWTKNLTTAENNLAGGCVASCAFTIYYAGWATAINDVDGNPLGNLAPGLDTSANGVDGGYEYTIFATLNARLTGFSGTSFTFAIDGSSTFDIYYDTAANATIASGAAWSNFKDGTVMVSGNLFSVTDQSFNTAAGAPNSVSLFGGVSFSGPQFSPALQGTLLSSTLQLFPGITGSFSPPTSVDGTVVGDVSATGDEALFRADANQDFFRVPEPTSMALAGLALLAAGAISRRRQG
jgi:hypothetical protein